MLWHFQLTDFFSEWSCSQWLLRVSSICSCSAQVYNVTADSTLSRKRRASEGEDASVAKKAKQPGDEDSEAEATSEGARGCGMGVVSESTR